MLSEQQTYYQITAYWFKCGRFTRSLNYAFQELSTLRFKRSQLTRGSKVALNYSFQELSMRRPLTYSLQVALNYSFQDQRPSRATSHIN